MNRAAVPRPLRIRSPIEPVEEEPALSPQPAAPAAPWPSFTAYALLSLESLLWLIQPLVLGWAINGLLRSDYAGLLAFAAGHLLYLLVSSARRLHETRALSALHPDPVPALIRALSSLAGALLLLAVYDWLLVPFCLLLLVPALLLNEAHDQSILRPGEPFRDGNEHEADRQRPGTAAGRRTRRSEAEAIRFVLMQLFVLAGLVGALVHFCAGATTPPPAGDIFAVFCYLLMFIAGLDALPRIARLIRFPHRTRLRLRTPPSVTDA